MARRRKEKNPVEVLFGLMALLVLFAMVNPAFRNKLASFAVSLFLIVCLLGIFGSVIYLIVQANKSKEVPIRYPVQNPVQNPVRKPVRNSVSPNTQYQAKDTGNFDIGIAPRPVHEEILPMEWDDTILKIIEWRRFEIVTNEFLRMSGFNATETKAGADGGVDIRIHKTSNPEVKGIVQCKAWNTYKVGIKIVRELFGVMAADRISMGMVVTSGEFTSEAVEFAKGKITLISGQRFNELIRKFPEEKQQHLLDVALEGDYKTPTCPQCDIKLALRESSKGRNTGGHFWGCVNYPKCRQTLVYNLHSRTL